MITKDNNYKVMQLLFKYPSHVFHIRELARLTRLSSAGIIKIIKRLKKEKLILSKKEKMTENITPDFDGKFIHTKRIYNINSLYDSGLMNVLLDFYDRPEAIIIFGSYGEGTDIEKSDVDIAVVSRKRSIPDIHLFEKKLARRINVLTIKVQDGSKEFKNSLANGIVLEGFLNLYDAKTI